MNDCYLTLRMNLTLDAPEGAGWYVFVTGEDRALIPAKRVGPPAALRLAKAFEEALFGQLDGLTPPQIVESGNGLIRQRLAEQLEYAEEQARRIKMLRSSLAALEPPSDTIDSTTEE